MIRDIWVIVFDDDEEIFLLKKQIQSLILYKNTLTYNIIINCSNDIEVRKKFKKQGITALLDTAKFECNIFKRSDFLTNDDCTTPHTRDNYICQQLLKLQIYKRSRSKEHLVLDSKVILLNSRILNVNEPNRDISYPINFYGCYDYFITEWHNGSIIPVKGTATPFLFKRDVLESLEQYFSSKNQYFETLKKVFYVKSKKVEKIAIAKNPNFKNSPDCLSEFLIYSLFEKKINSDNITVPKKKNIIQRADQINDQLYSKNFLKKCDVLLFHRKFVKEIGIKKAELIINYYLEKRENS
jgi:hypothetical protein